MDHADDVSQHGFGGWLKQQRNALHLTQDDLAERISCSRALVRKIESGERTASPQMAEIVAEFFSVAPDERTAFVQFAQGRLSNEAIEYALWQTLHNVQAHPTNLVAPLTKLIGRDQELEALHSLLKGKRLVTLTGPPGIGKTRLSLEVGAGLLDRFEDGVFFVALASVVDPDLVAPTIAQVLGISDKGPEPSLEKLRSALSNKHMLLVLDNFEQVLDASPMVVDLLGVCPRLRILITSREALHVYGEHQFHVSPLTNVDLANLPAIETMQGIPALALFIERAQAVNPDFMLTKQNAAAVASICAQLDGLPLAIELAAGRIRLLSPQEMQARFSSWATSASGLDAGQKLPLLTGGARNLPERQRTLRAAIDWSYNLLHKDEQTLFFRLGVFVGGFTLSAVAAIYKPEVRGQGPGISLAEDAIAPDSEFQATLDVDVYVQEGVASLLDKNLLKRDEGVDGESRFSMLELIREYASERLHASGEEEVMRYRLAVYLLNFAEAGERALEGAMQRPWLSKFQQEHANIRVALRWLLNSEEAILALRLSIAMHRFWFARGHFGEGRCWLEEALLAARATTQLVPAHACAKALHDLGHFAQQEDDHREAVGWLEESFCLFKEEGDKVGTAAVLRKLAFSFMHLGDTERAVALGREGLALGLDSQSESETARLSYGIAGAALFKGDFQQAEEFATKSVAFSRTYEQEDILSAGLNILGLIAHYQGDYIRAEEFYEEGLFVARQIGAKHHVLHAAINLGDLILLQGDNIRSAQYMNEGLRLAVEMGSKSGVAEGLEGMAGLAAAAGQPERAARLFGAAEALREALNIPLPVFARAADEHTVGVIRAQMAEDIFMKAWAEGRAMTLAQAAEYALEYALEEPNFAY